MKPYAFGVDIGGTTVKLGLFTTEGVLVDKWEIPTVTDNGGAAVLPDVAASIKNKLTEKNIAASDGRKLLRIADQDNGSTLADCT